MSIFWVCDCCMKRIRARDVAVWADYEHVICITCDEEMRDSD